MAFLKRWLPSTAADSASEQIRLVGTLAEMHDDNFSHEYRALGLPPGRNCTIKVRVGPSQVSGKSPTGKINVDAYNVNVTISYDVSIHDGVDENATELFSTTETVTAFTRLIAHDAQTFEFDDGHALIMSMLPSITAAAAVKDTPWSAFAAGSSALTK
jgi:hypothetical protein